MKQIFVIHGGDTFETYGEYLKFLKEWEIDFDDYLDGKSDWKRSLPEKLGDGYEIIYPNMPNKINAKYLEWKIWFDKFVPYFKKEVILIGHSLGGIFLAKYLAEEELKQKVKGLFLVAAPFDAEGSEYSMADFVLPDNLDQLNFQCDKIFIYHSEDDPIVPFVNAGQYKNKLKKSVLKVFKDRGHFNQEELPELIVDIQSL